ncbi:MAG: hypothetical protein GYA36_20030 [Veillonellaceae bacterium]|nr:hypothetical protein [Veillonellaceae bacterium]
MLSNMMNKYGMIDLTKPGAWGKFVHNVREDHAQQVDHNASVETKVTVFNSDGKEVPGRYDILSNNVIYDVKSHNLDAMSDKKLANFLVETYHQIQGYQWSPNIEGKPDAAVILENPPSDSGRRNVIEQFFEKRDINVIWGK